MDRREFVSAKISQLETIAREAAKAGQHNNAIGALAADERNGWRAGKQMNARKLSMRQEVEAMLTDLSPLITAAADTGSYTELKGLIDRRDALRRILDATTTDD